MTELTLSERMDVLEGEIEELEERVAELELKAKDLEERVGMLEREGMRYGVRNAIANRRQLGREVGEGWAPREVWSGAEGTILRRWGK